ncbi:hypothetical protein COE58_24270 [Bacillus cereus]|nr:hypothetical protein COE58_24270 [Bacillus cereus]
MENTGINRKITELGGFIIPRELRRTLNINNNDLIEIYKEEDAIILRKYEANMACMITGDVSNGNFSLFDGKIVVSPKGAELLIKELDKMIVPGK